MTDNPRTDLVRREPWVLILVGVVLVALAVNAENIVVALVGFLVAVAGTALWVVKIARR